MGPRKNGPIWPIVRSGNFEISSQTGFEPVTLRATVGSLIHKTKFPSDNFFKIFKLNLKRSLQSFCCRVASWIEQQSAISFEKTKNKNRQ